MASFAIPIHAISFSDDELAPSRAIEAMLSLYSGSSVTHEVVSPEDHGLQALGHMGFFRSRGSNSLWCVAADRIDALPGTLDRADLATSRYESRDAVVHPTQSILGHSNHSKAA